MTTTYDPRHPAYYDEDDLRGELGRVFDLCHGCRLCWNLCPSFGSLFDMIDTRHDGNVGAMAAAEQDRVVDECYQCKLCYVKCPYVPPHEWNLDFPRLMLRAAATRRERHGGNLADQFLGRTDLVGALSSAVAPVANAALGQPGSLPRRLMEQVVGIAAQRVLPLYAVERFSVWFKKRPRPALEARNGRVAVFQTCLVEYQNPAIGHDAIKVYERNGIACDVPEGTVCCGMPWLDAGDVRAFIEQARKNARVLAAEVRQGKDVVVLQPTCGYVLKKEYPDYVGSEDAKLVGAHTYDVAEYLVRVHRAEGKGLDLQFSGPVPETITWHAPCHLRAQNIGFKSRDLLKLTGAKVVVVDKCAGIDGTWGLRARNYALARKVAQPLKAAIEKAHSAVVAGDCHLANGAIIEETGQRPLHPIQVLARAYGIAEEPQP
ncbi:MAG: 4Fe-4S dicluster domain-containing protein [Chloroflexi bacterium]|nr:4Fe-4S dicluster domain-containing protein [Chloroflexota bacterium]